jgi:hypothetical protein
MDQTVLEAMSRWPNVPAVYDWLRLDARGQFHLIQRDRSDFNESTHGRGEPITNSGIVDFIWRNYACNEQGEWFWQNGPQRVFVRLDKAPLVLRLSDHDGLGLSWHHALGEGSTLPI